ncbi:ribosome maturation factor RimM [uncultured Pseudokineococcus sp.]|uniref:ribosome maturation factor RimM n=1 Tax=uncultured Pseudokineococcus sp. TaxID=1642928 RepID=UPI00260B71EA|nr:ribosome maturation factor RimM [uncultured Pseudokineococcus sp.]
MELVVARAGRPHGLRGEVALEVRTDDPGRRLAVGARLRTDPDVGVLTIASSREHQGRPLVVFAEVADRTAAEELRGVLLLVDVDPDDPAEVEEDAWHRDQLVGLRATTVDGRDVGEVVGLEHLPAQDALVLRQPSGATALVPFVRSIVPEVDVPGGRVVLDPPGGLLEAVPAEDDEAADDGAEGDGQGEDAGGAGAEGPAAADR